MDPEATKYQVRPRCIEFALEKAEEGPYWERLLAEKTKQHWLKVHDCDGNRLALALLLRRELIPLFLHWLLYHFHCRWTLVSGRTRMTVTQRARGVRLVEGTLRR